MPTHGYEKLYQRGEALATFVPEEWANFFDRDWDSYTEDDIARMKTAVPNFPWQEVETNPELWEIMRNYF